MFSCTALLGCQPPDAKLGLFSLAEETSSTGTPTTMLDGTTLSHEPGGTAEENTESTGGLLACPVEEWFEGETMDPGWEVVGSLPLEHTGTTLQIALVEAEGLNMGGAQRSDPFEPSVVTVAIGSAPNPQSSGSLQVELSTPETTVMLKVTGGRISSFLLQGPDVTGLGTDAPHDVAEHAWVRFVLEPAAMAIERSVDGTSWESLWSGPQPLSLASGELTSSLSGRTTELTTEPGVVAFDAFSICPLP